MWYCDKYETFIMFCRHKQRRTFSSNPHIIFSCFHLTQGMCFNRSNPPPGSFGSISLYSCSPAGSVQATNMKAGFHSVFVLSYTIKNNLSKTGRICCVRMVKCENKKFNPIVHLLETDIVLIFLLGNRFWQLGRIKIKSEVKNSQNPHLYSFGVKIHINVECQLNVNLKSILWRRPWKLAASCTS